MISLTANIGGELLITASPLFLWPPAKLPSARGRDGATPRGNWRLNIGFAWRVWDLQLVEGDFREVENRDAALFHVPSVSNEPSSPPEFVQTQIVEAIWLDVPSESQVDRHP